MGLITGLMQFLFGDGRNVVAETAQVFRENAEQGAVRAADARADSLQQFAAEFAHPTRGIFDRIVDGLNRLPRPALALGTIWLFVSAMRTPQQFAQGMQGLALVPEPLWWLMGAIVSFYFGARHQVKAFEFQTSIARALAAPSNVPTGVSDNPALQEWQVRNGQ
ncbi:holin family protein [Yoonia sp.]|uniref:holin family protein n=1 Tax=Yoonia sp. TaxID=2212373 RepID=UPI0025F05885|nr:holin family protein [Yoonia sp.]